MHDVHQGEGGEQGDALMPALFALGQHQALVAVHDQLTPHERLFVFLDDICVVCTTCCSVNCGSIPGSKCIGARRSYGTEAEMGVVAGCFEDPDAIVWSDLSLSADQQGVEVLGTPLGSSESVQAMLESLPASHQGLVAKISHITDLQSAWLLLLNGVSPELHLQAQATDTFAARHDVSMWRCVEILLDVSITNHTLRRCT